MSGIEARSSSEGHVEYEYKWLSEGGTRKEAGGLQQETLCDAHADKQEIPLELTHELGLASSTTWEIVMKRYPQVQA